MSNYFKKYRQFINEYGEGKYAEYDNSSGDKFWGSLAAGVLPIAKKTGKILLNYNTLPKACFFTSSKPILYCKQSKTPYN